MMYKPAVHLFVMLALSLLRAVHTATAPLRFIIGAALVYALVPFSPLIANRLLPGSRRARDSIHAGMGRGSRFLAVNQTGALATSPFVFVIMAVIALVVMLSMGSTVVTTVDGILTTASSGSNFSLTGIVFQFVPVIFITGALAVAGLIAFIGGVTKTSDLTQQIILSAIAVLIGISAATAVLTSATAMDAAVTAAVNVADLSLTATVIPFVPVIYGAGILAIAGMPWISRLKGMSS